MQNIHIQTTGHGDPLVLIHGWAMHSGLWLSFVDDLAQHYQVITVDLPGHGLSAESLPFNLKTIGEQLLKAIPVPRFRVLGWSLGATVALALAQQAPERVQGVCLLAGNPHFTQTADWPGIKPQVLDAFANQLSDNAPLTLTRFLALQVNGLDNGKALLRDIKTAVNACPAPSIATLQAGLEILLHADLRSVLKNPPCPVSVIQGNRDTLIPTATAEAIQTLNPAITVQILDRASHVPFLSHSSAIVERLLATL